MPIPALVSLMPGILPPSIPGETAFYIAADGSTHYAFNPTDGYMRMWGVDPELSPTTALGNAPAAP